MRTDTPKTDASCFEPTASMMRCIPTVLDAYVPADRARELEREVIRLRAEITRAIEMHLGRCASSEPFTKHDYRHHACEARDILRAALSARQY